MRAITLRTKGLLLVLFSLLLVVSGAAQAEVHNSVALTISETGSGSVTFSLARVDGNAVRFTLIDFQTSQIIRQVVVTPVARQAQMVWDGRVGGGKHATPGFFYILVHAVSESGMARPAASSIFRYRDFLSQLTSIQPGQVGSLITLHGEKNRVIESGDSLFVPYSLSRPAAVRAFIRDSAGRTLLEVATNNGNAPQFEGDYQFVAQPHDRLGGLLPSGKYKLAVTAYTADRQQTQAIGFIIVDGRHALPGTATGGSGGPGGGNSGTPGAPGNAPAGIPRNGNNGVRDHGIGEGRDEHGQGKGKGSTTANK